MEIYGSLPLLFGCIPVPDHADEAAGTGLGTQAALADSPAAIDALDALTNRNVPWLAQFGTYTGAQCRVPDGWSLDLAPPADSTSERPRTGPLLRIHEPKHILSIMLSRSHATRLAVSEGAGYIQIIHGSITARGFTTTVAMRALSHRSPTGLLSLGVTNLPDTGAGWVRLATAVKDCSDLRTSAQTA